MIISAPLYNKEIITFKRHNPRAFNTWAKEFFPGENYLPNTAHYFLKVLQDKEKLSKYFTQNIDGLEKLAGSSQPQIIDVFDCSCFRVEGGQGGGGSRVVLLCQLCAV